MTKKETTLLSNETDKLLSSSELKAAKKSLSWRKHFDERQLKEINQCKVYAVRFNKVYARDFNHKTDCHNAKLIIAKMAKLLDELPKEDKP